MSDETDVIDLLACAWPEFVGLMVDDDQISFLNLHAIEEAVPPQTSSPSPPLVPYVPVLTASLSIGSIVSLSYSESSEHSGDAPTTPPSTPVDLPTTDGKNVHGDTDAKAVVGNDDKKSAVFKTFELDHPLRGMSIGHLRDFSISLVVEIQMAEQLLSILKGDRHQSTYEERCKLDLLIDQQAAKVAEMNAQHQVWYSAFLERVEVNNESEYC